MAKRDTRRQIMDPARDDGDLVARVAEDTARLPNREAWAEIWVRLLDAGRSARQEHRLRQAVWAARRNVATAAAVDALAAEADPQHRQMMI